MGWWSHHSRDSHKTASGPTGDADISTTDHVERPGTSDRRQEIVAALKAHLETSHRSKGTATERLAFDPTVDLYEAGYLDSLSVSEFLLLTEKQYGVALPDWLIGAQANTLAALAAYIEGELARHRS